MAEGTGLNLTMIFFISVSLFGSFVTLMLAFHPPATVESVLWRKPLIGSIFSLICMSGIVAAFFPKKCPETFHLSKRERSAVFKVKNPDFHEVSITLKGHHPDCGRFSAHVIHVDKRFVCAACAGLLLGAFIALVGTALYFFSRLETGQVGFSAVLAGQVGVLLGFIQFKFKGYARLAVNTFFVFSTFLTLAGIDSIARNMFIDLYLIVLIVFWLSSRILISQWDHWRICRDCEISCEGC